VDLNGVNQAAVVKRQKRACGRLRSGGARGERRACGEKLQGPGQRCGHGDGARATPATCGQQGVVAPARPCKIHNRLAWTSFALLSPSALLSQLFLFVCCLTHRPPRAGAPSAHHSQ
jgi:hypothetical protein